MLFGETGGEKLCLEELRKRFLVEGGEKKCQKRLGYVGWVDERWWSEG